MIHPAGPSQQAQTSISAATSGSGSGWEDVYAPDLLPELDQEGLDAVLSIGAPAMTLAMPHQSSNVASAQNPFDPEYSHSQFSLKLLSERTFDAVSSFPLLHQ